MRDAIVPLAATLAVQVLMSIALVALPVLAPEAAPDIGQPVSMVGLYVSLVYGVGTLSYNTGSMSVTLGAIPDVGSPLIYTWGDTYAAVPASTMGSLPLRLGANISLPANYKPGSVALAFSARTNSASASGFIAWNAFSPLAMSVSLSALA